VSDNGVLNIVIMAKKEEVSEGWNQLRSKKIMICTIYHVL